MTAHSQLITSYLARVKSIINAPPNQLTPVLFLKYIASRIKNLPLEMEVLDQSALEKKQCNALLAFGSGSIHSPYLVKVSYSPNSSDKHRKLTLIGEGISFDAGGLQLKNQENTLSSKRGKAGAGLALEALCYAAENKLPCNVTIWLPLLENLPSGTAARPGDIVTLPHGLSVEITNLSGESHLGSADALSLAAQEAQESEVLLSLSSLDPMQNSIVGHLYSVVYGEESATSYVREAAKEAGEKVWPLPLPPYLEATLDSLQADTTNSTTTKASMLGSGMFIKKIIDTSRKSHDSQLAWAQWELGNTSMHHEKYSSEKGATAHGFTTLVSLMKKISTS